MPLTKLMDAGGNLSCDKGGVVTVTSPASTKVKASGQGVYFGNLAFTVAGAGSGSCAGASGGGSIAGSASKVKSGGQAAVLDGDNVTVTLTGVDSGTGAPCSFSAKVTANAAQLKVKGQ